MKFEDLHKEIETQLVARKLIENVMDEAQIPVEEYSGLSGAQIVALIKDFDTSKSVVRVNAKLDDALLDQIPFFVLLEKYLKIAERDGGLGLTGLGYVQRKPLMELYELKLIPVEQIEQGLWTMRGEMEWPAASMLHDVTLGLGWLRKYKGKLVLTKIGKQQLSRDRAELFRNFFVWLINNSWPGAEHGEKIPHIGEFMAFSLFLLIKFGTERRKSSFFSEKFLQAFPKALNFVKEEQFMKTKEDTFGYKYTYQTFECFLEWFGMIKSQKTKQSFFDDEYLVRTTPVFRKALILDETAKGRERIFV